MQPSAQIPRITALFDEVNCTYFGGCFTSVDRVCNGSGFMELISCGIHTCETPSYFDGVIPRPTVRVSRRMTRIGGLADLTSWELVISGPYHDHYDWTQELLATIKHECVHFYLCSVQRPCGHTKEFQAICQRLGAPLQSRPMPRCRPVYRYVVECPHCQARWRTGSWKRHAACRACCDHYNGGHYTRRFALTLVERQIVPA